MAAMPMRKLRLWQDKIETEVAIFGSGPPLVFLHGSWGLRDDQEKFFELLAPRTRSMRQSIPEPAKAIRKPCIRSTTGGT